MLRSTKSSTPFRSNAGGGGGSTFALGSASSSASKSNNNNNNQHTTGYDNGMHPNLGLHSAAATGNVGLVKFALDNGQPHTSILNGLLPLHAACSGGSEPAVRMLLYYGANINATRIKVSKASSAGPGTGTEGSTPLHFACANGHLSIVRLLLENGARPTSKDRDHQTPLSLASSQGHSACVSLLKSWISAYGPNGLAASPSTNSDFFSQEQTSSSPLRNQRSFESFSSAAAGVKASLRNHKKQALAKVNSNPNLKSIASSSSYHSSAPFVPPPLPTSIRNTSEAAPQSIPSSTLTPENKRRPSLPAIVEKPSHPSSTTQPTAHTDSVQSHQAKPVDELTMDESSEVTKAPVSLSPLNHRLQVKKSSTGLRNKASSSNIGESVESKYINNSFAFNVDDSRSSAPVTTANIRGRSDSESLTPASSSRLVPSNSVSTSMTSSPSSSMDRYDNPIRQNSTPSQGYRPRKSSNLSVTSSTLSPANVLMSFQDDKGSLSVEQGRKRSQSTTCVPKRSNPASEMESFRKLSLSQYVVRQGSETQSDDTKEILQSLKTPAKERSNNPTRYRSHRSPLLSSKLLRDEMDSKIPSSPSQSLRQLHSQQSTSSLISSTSSSNTHPKTTRGNSFTTSVGLEEDDDGEASKIHSEAALNPLKLYGSPGYAASSASKTSTSSIGSSFGAGMSAQEQAQAILRTAEDRLTPSGHVPATSLTQMLAAYGEALSQERKIAKSPYTFNSLRNKGSIASLPGSKCNYQLPIVQEMPAYISNGDHMSTPIVRNQMGSFASESTPPESPQLVQCPAESSAISKSRLSPSQHLQRGKMVSDTILSPPLHVPQSTDSMQLTSINLAFNGRQIEAAWSKGTADVNEVASKGTPSPPSHRHSPSLPSDLSQFSGANAVMAMNSPETTPRSKQRRAQQHSSVSESYSFDYPASKRLDPPSPLSVSKSSTPQTPELLQHTPSFNTSENEAITPLSDYETSPEVASAANQTMSSFEMSGVRRESEKDVSTTRLSPSSSQVGGIAGKRKGSTVKAFFHGIKNNVTMR